MASNWNPPPYGGSDPAYQNASNSGPGLNDAPALDKDRLVLLYSLQAVSRGYPLPVFYPTVNAFAMPNTLPGPYFAASCNCYFQPMTAFRQYVGDQDNPLSYNEQFWCPPPPHFGCVQCGAAAVRAASVGPYTYENVQSGRKAPGMDYNRCAQLWSRVLADVAYLMAADFAEFSQRNPQNMSGYGESAPQHREETAAQNRGKGARAKRERKNGSSSPGSAAPTRANDAPNNDGRLKKSQRSKKSTINAQQQPSGIALPPGENAFEAALARGSSVAANIPSQSRPAMRDITGRVNNCMFGVAPNASFRYESETRNGPGLDSKVARHCRNGIAGATTNNGEREATAAPKNGKHSESTTYSENQNGKSADVALKRSLSAMRQRENSVEPELIDILWEAPYHLSDLSNPPSPTIEEIIQATVEAPIFSNLYRTFGRLDINATNFDEATSPIVPMRSKSAQLHDKGSGNTAAETAPNAIEEEAQHAVKCAAGGISVAGGAVANTSAAAASYNAIPAELTEEIFPEYHLVGQNGPRAAARPAPPVPPVGNRAYYGSENAPIEEEKAAAEGEEPEEEEEYDDDVFEPLLERQEHPLYPGMKLETFRCIRDDYNRDI